MTEEQMIEAMARAILGNDIAGGEFLMNAAVPEAYATALARAALDAIREHVTPSTDMIERLTAERDALQAEKDKYESPAWVANERLNEAVERLVEERDAALADCDHWRKDYTELQRLHLATDELLKVRTIERDAAMAWFRAVEKTGSALCQTFDLATPAEEALRDVLTTACSLAEFEAFRAGAEAMRRKAAWLLEPQNDKSDWTPYAHDCHRLAEAIRALPIGAPT